MYKYGMRLRGFAPMCQPMEGFIERQDDPSGRYYDILVYERRLTIKEINEYELDMIGVIGGEKQISPTPSRMMIAQHVKGGESVKDTDGHDVFAPKSDDTWALYKVTSKNSVVLHWMREFIDYKGTKYDAISCGDIPEIKEYNHMKLERLLKESKISERITHE